MAGRTARSAPSAPAPLRWCGTPPARTSTQRRNVARTGTTLGAGPPAAAAPLHRVEASASTGIGNRGDQKAGVRMLRIGQQRHRLAALDELAGEHHHDPVGEVPCRCQVMRDVQHRDALLLAQGPHEVEDADTHRDVEHGGGFVGEDESRVHGQCPRDRDALPLPARQLVRVTVQQLRRQVDLLHEPALGALELAPAGDRVVQPQRPLKEMADAVHRIQRAERVLEDHLHGRAVLAARAPGLRLEDVLALEQEGAARGLLESCKAPGESRLAAAGFTDEGYDLARCDVQVDAAERAHASAGERPTGRERLLQAANGHHGRLLRGHRIASVRGASPAVGATQWPGPTATRSGMSWKRTPSPSPLRRVRGPLIGGNAFMRARV